MTLDQLIILLIDRGLKLIHLGDGKLDVRGPKKALTPDLLDAIRTHKRELLRRMRAIEDRDGIDGHGRLDLLLSQSAREVAA